MTHLDPISDFARGEARAGFEDMMRQIEIRRVAYGSKPHRRSPRLLSRLALVLLPSAALAGAIVLIA